MYRLIYNSGRFGLVDLLLASDCHGFFIFFLFFLGILLLSYFGRLSGHAPEKNLLRTPEL